MRSPRSKQERATSLPCSGSRQPSRKQALHSLMKMKSAGSASDYKRRSAKALTRSLRYSRYPVHRRHRIAQPPQPPGSGSLRAAHQSFYSRLAVRCRKHQAYTRDGFTACQRWSAVFAFEAQLCSHKPMSRLQRRLLGKVVMGLVES